MPDTQIETIRFAVPGGEYENRDDGYISYSVNVFFDGGDIETARAKIIERQKKGEMPIPNYTIGIKIYDEQQKAVLKGNAIKNKYIEMLKKITFKTMLDIDYYGGDVDWVGGFNALFSEGRFLGCEYEPEIKAVKDLEARIIRDRAADSLGEFAGFLKDAPLIYKREIRAIFR